MGTQSQKKQLALAAIEHIKGHDIIGVGTGSTVNEFIQALADVKGSIEAAVASSKQTEKLLKQIGIDVVDLNSVNELPIYVDGADEFVSQGYLIKGGGGALTREKICTAASREFLCLADNTKKREILGSFPVAIEVIPMARSYVARTLVKLGANPIYRVGYITDNGNHIIDAHDLDLVDPIKMSITLNNIVGVVAHGLFAAEKADTILTIKDQQVIKI